MWIEMSLCDLILLIKHCCKIYFQAIAETQLLRLTNMSTGLLMVFVDSAKNLPVSYICLNKIQYC